MTAAPRADRKPASLRTLWGIARNELGLTGDELHAVVYRETGKASMKELSQRELEAMARVLRSMAGGHRAPSHKRTDEGGDPRTVEQRRKVYQLAQRLGWTEAQVNGLTRRMFQVERQEWLGPGQCYKLIEALKAMVERRKN